MSIGYVNTSQIFSIVQKIKSTFQDNLNPLQSGFGSEFWIKRTNGNDLYVTNKHNIEPSMNNKLTKEHQLSDLLLFFRFTNNENIPFEQHIEVNALLWDRYIDNHENSDVVILKMPANIGVIPSECSNFIVYEQDRLADNDFFNKFLQVGDDCTFIGFPKNIRKNARYDFPIARNCILSSFPLIDYSDEDETISTKNISLVSGFSFKGSSGSILFNNEKGVKVDGKLLSGGGYVEPKIIGIMSGHWDEDLHLNPFGSPEHFHSGLSYFTKSTAILRIINQHNL